MKLDDIKGSLGDTLQRYWKPALAGAALGGTTAGYLSRNTGEPGETPGNRRRRMLRNALAGVLLGGTAGLAIPAGARIAAQPWAGKKPSGWSNPLDKGIDTVGGNIAPAVVGAVGTAGILKSRALNREEAFKNLYQNFHSAESAGKWKNVSSPEALRAALAGRPGAHEMVRRVLANEMKSKAPGLGQTSLRAQEQLAEAGFRSQGGIKRLLALREGTAPRGYAQGARALAAEHGGLGKLISSVGAHNTPPAATSLVKKLTGGDLPGILQRTGDVGSELYRKAVRPTIGGRWSTPSKVLGLVAAAALAKKLQNKALGE